MRCIEALGIQVTDEGIIRISLVHYNTEDEVSRLVEGLDNLKHVQEQSTVELNLNRVCGFGLLTYHWIT